jgi:predicted metalloprotease with PDZ domain
MKKLLSLSLFLAVGITNVYAQQSITYDVDLSAVVNDQIIVKGTVTGAGTGAVSYSFPKVVPGTYAIEDYGKYIENFQAFDANNSKLTVKKEGNNTYIIAYGEKLHHFTYSVNDAMDMQVKKDKIFEPASTNIVENSNIVMNNGGFFGCFDGMQSVPHFLAVLVCHNYLVVLLHKALKRAATTTW